MKQMLRWGKTLAAMVLVTSLPALLQAQSEGRFTGTVLDPSGAAVPGATVSIKNERTGSVEDRRHGRGGPLRRDRTAAVDLHDQGVRPVNFAPLEYTGMQLLAAQEFALDLQLQAGRRHRDGHGHGAAPTRSISARRASASTSASATSQNLPVNGRQMSQLMLQAPGSLNSGTGTWQDVRFSRPRRRAERHPLRRRRRLGDHRRGAGQPQRRDSDAVQAAGEPRERAGVPRRVEQLPGGVRHRHRRPGERRHQVGQPTCSHGSVFEYYRNDKLDAPNYFDDARPGAAEVDSSTSTSSAARSAARS